MLDGHADQDSEGDEDSTQTIVDATIARMNDCRRTLDSTRDQRGVDAQAWDQPADRDPSPSRRAKPCLDALEVALLAQAPGQPSETSITDGASPAVADQRPGDAGDERQRYERIRIEPAGCDEQARNQEHQLPRGERQRDACLLGEEQRGEQRQRNHPVQPRKKRHRRIIPRDRRSVVPGRYARVRVVLRQCPG